MADVWAGLTPGRVVPVDPARPVPASPPLVVVACQLDPASSVGTVIESILTQLDLIALVRYPAWLPAAEMVDTGAGSGVAAVRTVARKAAADRPGLGPFLADLAERSLRHHSTSRARPRSDRAPAGTKSWFSREVRAAGLALVLATASGAPYPTLLVIPSGSLTPVTREIVHAACEWLASSGRFAVGLGGDGASSGKIEPTAVPPAVPGGASEPSHRTTAGTGRPHPASSAEQALEQALARQPWAAGRRWNTLFQPDPLSPQFRVDLMWPEERCAVEIDGPEHRSPHQYEADRRRDTALQLAGFAVLRFTNSQVSSDLAGVLRAIRELVTNRRQTKE